MLCSLMPAARAHGSVWVRPWPQQVARRQKVTGRCARKRRPSGCCPGASLQSPTALARQDQPALPLPSSSVPPAAPPSHPAPPLHSTPLHSTLQAPPAPSPFGSARLRTCQSTWDRSDSSELLRHRLRRWSAQLLAPATAGAPNLDAGYSCSGESFEKDPDWTTSRQQLECTPNPGQR